VASIKWIATQPEFTATHGRDRGDDVTSFQVPNPSINPSPTIKSLSATFDHTLSFDAHVTNVCRLCYCHIRALRHVRESLPVDVARTVACSIIGSRLDYCNSLLVGTFKSKIKMQRIQNTLTRLSVRHIKPVMNELHWLPLEKRAAFKLATQTCNIKSTGQPVYLRNLLSVHTL